MIFKQKDFDIDIVLSKPLMAHLATLDHNEPRDSPVWFIWEEAYIWVFGTTDDSFIKRLKRQSCCSIGIVDFDLQAGVLKHVGIRGIASVTDVNHARLNRFISKYLGNTQANWNKWFIA